MKLQRAGVETMLTVDGETKSGRREDKNGQESEEFGDPKSVDVVQGFVKKKTTKTKTSMIGRQSHVRYFPSVRDWGETWSVYGLVFN